MELSIIIPALNEEKNIAELIPRLGEVASQISPEYEIILVDGGSTDNTREIARRLGARVIIQKEPGYGGALKEGFRAAQGEYILTLDGDLSHEPAFIPPMWQARKEAEIVIASRYVPGGSAKMPLTRKILSRILNTLFTMGLSLPLKDISSGFRLYRAICVNNTPLKSRDFDILEEIIIRCYAQGWRIKEIPFQYVPRKSGRSHVKLFRFGIAYLRTFRSMWRLRNSSLSADYDDRAFSSRIPLQRYWQRSRYKIITAIAQGVPFTLDIGCGSSKILGALENGVGLDLNLPKLRYAKRHGKPVINATIYALPFRDESFDCIICSQVVEHLPPGKQPFLEMARVLKKGGSLILGTPDYGKLSWRIIERLYALFAPQGYASEHITRYTRNKLIKLFEELGFFFREAHYILNSELIMLFKKLDNPPEIG